MWERELSLVPELISERAYDAAETLLEAFYFQDERESYLLREAGEAANRAGAKAVSRMASAFRVEFPHVTPDRATMAGEKFMDGLFLQDEIENWEFIAESIRGGQLKGAILSDPDEPYEEGVVADPRWGTVTESLGQVCRHVGINRQYATTQTRFWMLHGQKSEYWIADARDAHRIKLRAMVGSDLDPETAERLATCFVRGVEAHDRWRHLDRDRDVDEMVDLVAAYYQKVFDLREAVSRDVDS